MARKPNPPDLRGRDAGGAGSRPLLGRADERAVLGELFSGVEDGFGGALVVFGEAGMGKTRLLEHAVTLVPDVPTVWITGVEAERDLGFAGLHRLLHPLLERRHELPGPQRDALGSAFGLDRRAPADRFMVGLACLTLLADAAGERGLVCVIDDAQWIDEESLAALAFVGRRLSADRLALLFGVRGGEAPGGALGGLPTLPVGGLDAEAALELLSTRVDTEVDAELAQRIVDETGGCPLALLELASELTDDELVGGRTVSGPLPIGRRLEDHFLRQVRALDAAAQLFLLVAATETSGDAPLVRQAAAALGAGPDAEDVVVASGLVTIAADHDVAFRHPLIRSATYGGAPADLRRRVHTTIAEHIDRQLDPDRRVQHLAAAARGADDALAGELRDAALRAEQRGSYSAASGAYAQAAELTEDPGRRGALLLQAATAALEAGRLLRVESLLERARPHLTDPLLLAEATRLDAVGPGRGELRAAPGRLLAAAQAFMPGDRHRGRVTLLDALHFGLIAQQHTTGVSLADIARVALDNPLEEGSPSMADLSLDAIATLVDSGYEAAVAPMKRLADTLGHDAAPPSFTDVYVGVMITNELWDDTAQATWCQRVEGSARERGALTPLQSVLNSVARYETRAGRFTQAESHFDEAIVIEAAIGGTPEVIELLKCDLYAWRGQEAETVRTAAALIQVGQEVGAANFEQVAQVALARLALSQGRYAEVIDAIRPIVEAEAPGFLVQVLALGVEAGRRAGDDDIAARCLQALEARAPAAGTNWALGQLAWSTALCASGDDEAERAYREAITSLAETSIATDLAHAHLLYGEWLRRENRRQDARRELRSAHEQFSAMGAARFARRARIELEATGEKVRRRSVEARSQLTPQEANVARLAATGATNAEIAARLFISANTVDYHLRKVFRKLDISSRHQLVHVALQGPWAEGDESPTATAR